jgi:uncharacterized protein YndB with AHSA1/START domain
MDMNNVIRREIELDFPIQRVWSAITNHEQFGEWFRVKFAEPFEEGKVASGRILHKGMEDIELNFMVQKIQPESHFSYTWHPYAFNPKVDYSHEKQTLVEFSLAPTSKGTQLTLTETGFDELPEARREEAWRMHEGGWAQQMYNIEMYLKEQ